MSELANVAILDPIARDAHGVVRLLDIEATHEATPNFGMIQPPMEVFRTCIFGHTRTTEQTDRRCDMQKAQFERIFGQSARQFGKIRRGEEDAYTLLIFPMESNALVVHRMYPQSNSLRMREAIALALYDIQERCTGRKVDVGKFRKENNERLEHALLMAFDPFTNDEVMEALGGKNEVASMTSEELNAYYKNPARCLLRIKDSIDIWERKSGSNGYFKSLEQFLGRRVSGDKMHYSILLR